MLATGFYDVRGIPIYTGDLIRVTHFRHYRRRQQMWLYFVVGVISERFVVYAYNRHDTHQCLLSDCGIDTAEVLDGDSYTDDSGNLVMWNERERTRKAVVRCSTQKLD